MQNKHCRCSGVGPKLWGTSPYDQLYSAHRITLRQQTSEIELQITVEVSFEVFFSLEHRKSAFLLLSDSMNIFALFYFLPYINDVKPQMWLCLEVISLCFLQASLKRTCVELHTLIRFTQTVQLA